jgi:riboflavin kinase/FMN adenylyltransferase
MVLKKHRSIKLLTTPPERELLMKSLGVDEIRFIHFSKAFSQNTPHEFFDRYLRQRFNAAGVVVGPDFRFGHNRTGDTLDLKHWGGRQIPLWPVRTAKAHSHKLSSRHIRELVKVGKLEEAENELGHRYFARGRVVHGNKIGRRMGFPTVNLVTQKGKILPFGVTAVKVFPSPYQPAWRGSRQTRSSRGWPGVCNIGLRPTITPRAQKISFEVHLLDRTGNLYGRSLWVEFISLLRHEKKFSSLDALRAQIQCDVQAARKLLFTNGKK